MKYKIFLLIPLIHASLWSDLPLLQKEQEAKALFGSRNYFQSIQVYEDLLKLENPEQWKKNVLLTNISTVNIAQSQWKNSLLNLKKISLENISDPSILIRLLINQGLIDFLQGQSIADNDLQLMHYEMSLDSIQQALKLNCTIQTAQKEECVNSEHLFQFAEFLEAKIKSLKDEQNSEQLKNSSLAEKNNQAVSPPKETLQLAIEKGKSALKLNRLLSLQQEASDADKQTIVEEQHSAILLGNQFLYDILKQQEDEYRSDCQKQPWNVVIPLFEEGYLEGKNAEELLNKEKDFLLALYPQELMIINWKKALEALLKPMQETNVETTKFNQEPNNTVNTFREFQQMYLEDTSRKSESTSKELKTW